MQIGNREIFYIIIVHGTTYTTPEPDIRIIV